MIFIRSHWLHYDGGRREELTPNFPYFNISSLSCLKRLRQVVEDFLSFDLLRNSESDYEFFSVQTLNRTWTYI